MKAEISIDIQGDDLAVEVEAYANCAVLRFGDLSINMSNGQFDLLLKEMRKWIFEDGEVTKLPERLSRDQAEPLCELICKDGCFRDCDCSVEVRHAWAVLRERLSNE